MKPDDAKTLHPPEAYEPPKLTSLGSVAELTQGTPIIPLTPDLVLLSI